MPLHVVLSSTQYQNSSSASERNHRPFVDLQGPWIQSLSASTSYSKQSSSDTRPLCWSFRWSHRHKTRNRKEQVLYQRSRWSRPQSKACLRALLPSTWGCQWSPSWLPPVLLLFSSISSSQGHISAYSYHHTKVKIKK